MMKKKLLALLTAVCSVFAMTALPAFAVSEHTWEVVEGDNGKLSVIVECGRYDGILVETDGTELTEDMVNTLDGYTSLMTWEEYTSSIIYWSGWHKTETSVIPEGECYMLSTEALDDETLLSMGRKLMLEQECVKDIYLVQYEEYGIGQLNFSFYATPVSSDIVLDETSIPELEGFHCSYDDYFGLYYFTADDISDFSKKLNLEDIGVYDYARYERAVEYANQIVENHSDILAKLEVGVIVPESGSSPSCTPTSIWHTAGDPNADGEVTAADASDMLMTAAELGAGADVAITSAEDVNADGTVDAQDAAAVLTYAAAQGSGNPLSWAEILR